MDNFGNVKRILAEVQRLVPERIDTSVTRAAKFYSSGNTEENFDLYHGQSPAEALNNKHFENEDAYTALADMLEHLADELEDYREQEEVRT